jgi:hypothetical protein
MQTRMHKRIAVDLHFKIALTGSISFAALEVGGLQELKLITASGSFSKAHDPESSSSTVRYESIEETSLTTT